MAIESSYIYYIISQMSTNRSVFMRSSYHRMHNPAGINLINLVSGAVVELCVTRSHGHSVKDIDIPNTRFFLGRKMIMNVVVVALARHFEPWYSEYS
jgi:hypothetical protein